MKNDTFVKCKVKYYDWIKKDEVCIFLGEISNMKDHGIFCL